MTGRVWMAYERQKQEELDVIIMLYWHIMP